MISLYPEPFSQTVHSLSCDFESGRIRRMLSIAKFFAKNGELAIKEFEKANLKNFDPLVRDRVCQRHTAVVLTLFEDPDLKGALEGLKPKLTEVLQKIDRYMQKPPTLYRDIVFGSAMETLKLCVPIDKKIQMVFFAHLLTIASSFHLDGTGGITYHIDSGKLRDRLSKLLEIRTIDEIVSVARTAFSLESAALFPTVVEKLRLTTPEEKALLCKRVSLKHSFTITEGNTSLTASNAFFSMDAVLRMAAEKQIPFLIKETDKNPPRQILLDYAEGKLQRINEVIDLDQPIIVLQAYFAKELSMEEIAAKITEIGLGEIVLANASLCLQFTSIDGLELLDDKAKLRIIEYRDKAVQTGCTLNDLKLLHIVHVYPSKMKDEQK